MSYIPQLIPIYANDDISVVENNRAILEGAFGGQDVETLSKNTQFIQDNDFVKEQKRVIEQNRPAFETNDRKAQIVQCLRDLLQLAIYEIGSPSTVLLKFDVRRDLFLARYGSAWSPAQRDHFTFVASRLREWRTYFLSYTNSGATIVNDKYKGIISRYVDPKTRAARNRTQDNLLAEAIVHQLQRRNMSRRSFYDKKAIVPGDALESTIKPAATGTLAFLQLVQLDMFTAAPDDNWPFREYQFFEGYNADQVAGREAYREVFDTRFIAILAGTPDEVTLEEFKLPAAYHPWRKRILETTHFLELPASKQQFESVIRTLENAILHRAYQLTDMVP